MKKWGIFLVLLTLWLLPGQGKDAAGLIPVEVVRVAIQNGQVQIKTDTGQTGIGADWTEAVQDLRAGAAGEVFLDTADVLLVGPGAENILNQLEGDIRPGCGVYRYNGEDVTEETAAYLRAHPSRTDFLEALAGKKIPFLKSEGGELRIEAAESGLLAVVAGGHDPGGDDRGGNTLALGGTNGGCLRHSEYDRRPVGQNRPTVGAVSVCPAADGVFVTPGGKLLGQ